MKYFHYYWLVMWLIIIIKIILIVINNDYWLFKKSIIIVNNLTWIFLTQRYFTLECADNLFTHSQYHVTLQMKTHTCIYIYC
jgi:hypothetical protein